MNMKIAVIGAGVSGLVTAKVLQGRGHEVTLIEQAPGIGGVWESRRSYPEVATQTPGDLYAFSDHPMPTEYPPWPSGGQIRSYLTSYAQRFGILPRIRFHTRLAAMKRRPDGLPGWRLSLQDVGADAGDRGTGAGGESSAQSAASLDTLDVDMMVSCTGTFHTPFMPTIAGRDEFAEGGGVVMHTSQLSDESALVGRKVVVVGFGKSACDVAMYALDRAQSVTMIFRTPNWKVPRYLGGLVSIREVLMSRFSEALFPQHRPSALERVLHSLGKPLVWCHWRMVETLLRVQFGLDRCGLRPDGNIDEAISCSLSLEPVGFYKAVHNRDIRCVQGTIDQFIPGGVHTSRGMDVDADVVIFGTGFQQDVSYLSDEVRGRIVDERGRFRLYRRVLPPEVADLAFVGFNSSLFSTLTSEVSAHWVAAYIDGTVPLPAADVMYRDIDSELHWHETHRPVGAEYGNTCVAPYNYHYLDTLLRDMGAPTRVRGRVADFFQPLDVAQYATILSDMGPSWQPH